MLTLSFFASKEQVVKALDRKQGFVVVPQGREDYVAFLWSDHANRSDAVLLEFFVTDFEGAPRYRASDVGVRKVKVTGDILKGDHPIALLDPFYIFKGKLRAAATRQKYHDAADLRWLEGKYGNILRQHRDEINIGYIGLALKRSPELESCFKRIGVDVEGTRKRVAGVDLSKLPAPAKGDVLKGILG